MNSKKPVGKDKLALSASAPFTETTPSKWAAFKECRDLLSPRLNKPQLDAFWKLAGLRLHIVWHDPLEFVRLQAKGVLSPEPGVILHHLESILEAGLARRELKAAQIRIKNLEAENAKLPRESHQHAPKIHEPPAAPGAGSRSRQIVQRMREYVHTNFHRTLHLRDVADDLKMNICYLSSLFSRTSGMGFHQYLDEFRLARAKELLRDPTCRSCEAASAVGYSDAGKFCRIFKAYNGLSPSLWRAGQRIPLRPL